MDISFHTPRGSRGNRDGMASQDLVELSLILFEDNYGKLGTRIIEVLLRRGRTTAAELAKMTGLAPSAVLRTLVSLVQTQTVSWWQTHRKTYYVANWFRIYSILWSGEILARHSDPAHARLLIDIMVNGGLGLQQLEKQFPDVSRREIEALVQSKKILKPVYLHEFWPESELREDLAAKHHRLIMSDHSQMALSETVKKEAVAKNVANELEKLREKSLQCDVTDSSVLTINYDRFLIVSRNSELVSFAKLAVGNITAMVYEQFLLLMEPKIESLHQTLIPSMDSTVTTMEIVKALQRAHPGLDLSQAFIELNPSESSEVKEESGAKRSKLNSGKSLVQPKAKLSNPELVNLHLQLLQDTPYKFIKRVGDRQGGEWFVAYNQVIDHLKTVTLDTIVAQSFGPPAARLLRIIRKMGKMDEKMLGARTLLPTTEIRHQMSTLHFYGLVDVQEIPRPSERNSQKRSYYLWYHRPDWAFLMITRFLYRSITDTLKDTRQLRAKHQMLLNKLERDDVKKQQDTFLTQKEKEELGLFQEAERQLIAKMYMYDRHVRIFRDY